MKKIEATVKAESLEDVQLALGEIGIEDMNVSEVKAFGRRKAHTEIYRGTSFPVNFLPEVKIELVLPDNRGDAAVAAILKGTKTGAASERKVFVSNIDDAVRN